MQPKFHLKTLIQLGLGGFSRKTNLKNREKSLSKNICKHSKTVYDKFIKKLGTETIINTFLIFLFFNDIFPILFGFIEFMNYGKIFSIIWFFHMTEKIIKKIV